MGLLITIEGGEFVGKTSVAVPGLKNVLEAVRIPVLTSREPGGTPEAEQIREEIFKKLHEGATQEELAVLFNQARKIHIDATIKPFLGEQKEKPAVVILDRYLDSTRVYQGIEGNTELARIFALEKQYVDTYYPDITFILYFPEQIFRKILLARQKLAQNAHPDGKTRSSNDWDDAEVEQQLLRQKHYLSLPDIAKQRGENRHFVFIDASKHPFEIIKTLAKEVGDYIMAHKSLPVQGNIRDEMVRACDRMQKEPAGMFLEKQWRMQQHLLSK